MSSDSFSPDPVMICTKCGKGFLTAPPNMIDPDPIWQWLDGKSSGPPCGGKIEMRLVYRNGKNEGR